MIENLLENKSDISKLARREEVWDEIQKKEKEGAMSEDEKFKAKEELQKIVDEANGSLEKLFERKEHDVMS